MKKNKPELYLAIFVVAVIVSTAFIYFQTQEKTDYGIFPEKLDDMNIVLYREGEVAISEVGNLHGGSVVPENAYIALYRSNGGNTAKFWVSESRSSEQAESQVAAMNAIVGKTGMFSESTAMTIGGVRVYFVTGQPQLGLYHYFYSSDRRVFWIQVDNPDKAYRESFVKEAINRI